MNWRQRVLFISVLVPVAGLVLNPGFTVRRVRTHLPSDNPIYLTGRARFDEGLRLAGVPEG